MTAKLFLWKKPRKADGRCHVKIYIGDKTKDRYYPLNIWIAPEHWTGVKVKDNDFRSFEYNNEIRDAIYKFETIIRNNPSATIEKVISIYEGEKTGNKLLPFVEQFIKDCKSGKIVRKLESIKTYNTAYNKLFEYNESLTFEDITLNFYNEWTSWMRKKGYSNNYIGCNVKCLKVFLAEATERGINTNLTFKNRKFKTFKEDVDNIYLSEKELTKIVNLKKLPEHLERVRDAFIFGAYTGLRFSDLSQVSKDKIKDKVLKLKQSKTGGEVIIPLKPVLLDIVKKYDKLPVLSNQKMNEHLKTICEKAGIIEWERVSTHTARRSFATNAYLAGVPPIAIMRLTGHKSEVVFLKYIKVTNQENAKELLKHKFFK